MSKSKQHQPPKGAVSAIQPEEDFVEVAQPRVPEKPKVYRKFFHRKCGKETRLGAVIAEKYAWDKPKEVFCINCLKPVFVGDCEWRD